MLVIVDLDEGDVDGAVGVFEVVGLVVAEEAVPEVEGFGEIGDEVACVGDAEDLRALDRSLGQKRACAEEKCGADCDLPFD